MKRPVVVCPLDIERRAAARAVKDRADVRVSGPGRAAIRETVAALKEERPPLVVLFGLAGGLRETETAPRIGRVVDKDGRAWLAPCVPPGESASVTIVGVDEAVLHRGRKHQMAHAYAAALVDMESHAFAQAAVEQGLRWAIVRGVSDGPDQNLPAAVTEWVDDKGRTRIARVVLSSLLNPSVLAASISLARRARPALRAGVARLVELLNTESALSGAGNSDAPEVVVPGPSAAMTPFERQLGRRGGRMSDADAPRRAR